MTLVEKFLQSHRLGAADVNIEQTAQIFESEMLNGLDGRPGSLRMIPTYIEADNEFLTGVPVVAIDAGGTNFRAALVTFSGNGEPEIADMVNGRMPGLDREISKEEFFLTIADYIRPLAVKADRIGFCFSYPTEILPDRDGRLLQFCKEVQAPGVVGQLIGKSLLGTLGMNSKKIVLLNDTVATLLAGRSAASGIRYDSFIGYILGTGTNTCYIEKNRNITKNPSLDQDSSQIINVESGNFGKAVRSDLDILFDNTTTNPGSYTFEKMFSGGYLGGLALTVLKAAAEEGVFSGDTSSKLVLIGDLTSEEVNSFVSRSGGKTGQLSQCMAAGTDEEACRLIIASLVERAAKLVAANLGAVMLRTGHGKSPEHPVLITVEGTLYSKLHNLKEQFDLYFREFLSGERQRYYKFTEVKHSSLIGAALAALIN
jgi:hexokinase